MTPDCLINPVKICELFAIQCCDLYNGKLKYPWRHVNLNKVHRMFEVSLLSVYAVLSHNTLGWLTNNTKINPQTDVKRTRVHSI